MDALLHLARAACTAEAAFISVVAGDRERILAHVGTMGDLSAGDSAPLSETLLAHVLTNRVPLAVADTRHHLLTRNDGWLGRSVAGAVLSVPLVSADGSQAGALTICDPLPHAWTARQIAALQHVAALSDALAVTPWRRDDTSASVLAAALRGAASAEGAARLTELMTGAVVPALADWCLIYRREDVGERSVSMVPGARPQTANVLETVLPVVSASLGARLGVNLAFDTGRPQRTRGALVPREVGLTASIPSSVDGEIPLREVIAVPITTIDIPDCVLVVARSHVRVAFDDAEAELVCQVAAIAAIGLGRFVMTADVSSDE